MKEAWPKATVWALDIRDEVQNLYKAGADWAAIGDYVQWIRFMKESNLITSTFVQIGNPPFSLAQSHLEASFECMLPGSQVHFLLRNGFLGGRERNLTFWQKMGGPYLKYLTPIAPRPSFVKGKNDNSEYAIFSWEIGWKEPAQVLPPLIWEKRVRPVK